MKLLKCVVRPNALEKVKEALNGLGVTRMAVSEIEGFGRQEGSIDQLPTDHTTQSTKGTWRTYSLAEGLAGIQVEHIAEDREGVLKGEIRKLRDANARLSGVASEREKAALDESEALREELRRLEHEVSFSRVEVAVGE